MKKFALLTIAILMPLLVSAKVYQNGDVLPCGQIYNNSTLMEPNQHTNAMYMHKAQTHSAGAESGEGVFKAN